MDQSKKHTVWEINKTKADLEPSRGLMSDDRKDMIRYAMQYDIKDIRTYSGYKGDLLIEITLFDAGTLERLKIHAISLGMETAVKSNMDLGVFELYCITPDNIYQLMDEPK